jgi:hypothetical protein
VNPNLLACFIAAESLYHFRPHQSKGTYLGNLHKEVRAKRQLHLKQRGKLVYSKT